MSRLREITRRVVAALDPGEHYIPPPAGAPAAAVAVYRATQDGGAEEAVLERVRRLVVDHGIRDDANGELFADRLDDHLRAALATQAGDGAR